MGFDGNDQRTEAELKDAPKIKVKRSSRKACFVAVSLHRLKVGLSGL